MDDDGEMKSAQAYQVIGILLLEPIPPISEAEAVRALDYFAASAKVDEDFLPWPNTPVAA